MFRIISLASLYLSSLSAQAALINPDGFGVEKNFVDSGLYTTEHRADGTVWEWLDLTVTNGIEFESIIQDMTNNNRLDNSEGVLTDYAYSNSVADVAALSEYESVGWELQSMYSIAAMINSYFGLSLEPDLNERSRYDFSYNYGFGTNTEIMETFVHLFGDTVHEGYQDSGLEMDDKNPNLPNIGYTYGITSSFIENHYYDYETGHHRYSKALIDAMVADFQLHEYETDGYDQISFSDSGFVTYDSANRGVWLARQVSVNEPSDMAVFFLGAACLLFMRHKN